MEKSLKLFLRNLHKCTKAYPISHFERWLSEKDIEKLKENLLLEQVGDLKEVLCDSCEEEQHFTPVQVKNGSLFTLCKYVDTSPRPIDESEVQTWTLSIENFLLQMATGLNISNEVESLNLNGLWQIGGFSKDETRHICYFYSGVDLNAVKSFIESQPTTFRRYVLITSKQATGTFNSDHQVIQVEVESLVDFNGRQLKFDKRMFSQYLINGFRTVQFNEVNGDLVVNGELVASVQPTSAEYYFIQLLWKNFNEPISYQHIAQFVYSKNKKVISDTMPKFCHKLKLSIKNKSIDALSIDKIFISTKDVDGLTAYIMKNP